MCGRFTNRLTWREIVALYRLSVPATPERNLPARYNISVAKLKFGVIIRKGATKPDVSRVHALKQTLMATKSIASGDPESSASGKYFSSLIERLRIADAIKPKIKTFSACALLAFAILALELLDHFIGVRWKEFLESASLCNGRGYGRGGTVYD
jgi:extracellular solute-binding protein